MLNGLLQSYLYKAPAAAAMVVGELCWLGSDLSSVGGGAGADSRSRYIAVFYNQIGGFSCLGVAFSVATVTAATAAAEST